MAITHRIPPPRVTGTHTCGFTLSSAFDNSMTDKSLHNQFRCVFRDILLLNIVLNSNICYQIYALSFQNIYKDDTLRFFFLSNYWDPSNELQKKNRIRSNEECTMRHG
jgi:hypothetical protein